MPETVGKIEQLTATETILAEKRSDVNREIKHRVAEAMADLDVSRWSVLEASLYALIDHLGLEFEMDEDRKITVAVINQEDA